MQTTHPGAEAAFCSGSVTRASYRQDLVTVLSGTWLVGALFSDGWAHHNVPELESFFTPWHGAMYAGLAASAAWLSWLGRSAGFRWYRALPVGYGWGAVGLGIFTVGGIADLGWHSVFGVEAGVDALLSPSHLVLFVGGMLILTSALRSRWLRSDTSSPVAQVAVALATALTTFFLLYVSEFTAAAPTVPYQRLPEGDPGHSMAELPATAGLGGFLLSTAVIVVPLLFVWQRGRAPRGLVAVLVITVSWLSAAVVDFGGAVVSGAIGASIGAVVADLLIQRLDETTGLPTGMRLPVFAGITAAVVWSAHMVALAMSQGLAWPTELWSGVIVLTAMSATVLAGLAAPLRAALSDAPGKSPERTTTSASRPSSQPTAP